MSSKLPPDTLIQCIVSTNRTPAVPGSIVSEPMSRRICLKHCGLWPSRTARAPPDVDELVLELDASYADNSMCSADEADEFHELTYVDIDTFLESF